MTVYVDDMHKYSLGRYGRMKMPHMIADNPEELHRMADHISVARRWYQGDHYDIAISKRTLAVQGGAVEVSMNELSSMARRQKVEGHCGKPSEARAWWSEYRRTQKEKKEARRQAET